MHAALEKGEKGALWEDFESNLLFFSILQRHSSQFCKGKANGVASKISAKNLMTRKEM